MTFGSLPAVWQSDDPKEELDSYFQMYIDSEIKSEGLVRKIPAFSRFLKTAALSNGELLDYQNISSDSGVPTSTLKEHYQILSDTMIGHDLEPWLESKKRKAISTSKFYFFDNGVLNQIIGHFPSDENDPSLGNRFETFIINEARCANIYQRRKLNLYFWRSTAKQEVDLIFGDVAIEIKLSRRISEKYLIGLKALKEEGKFKKYILVSQDTTERLIDGIFAMNYKLFLKRLWKGEI